MPNRLYKNSDIPFVEKDARYLETLIRTIIRILNTQIFITKVIHNHLPTENNKLWSAILKTLQKTNQDLLQLAIEILQSLVNLRRDAILQHSLIPADIAVWIRSRSFIISQFLFDTMDLYRVTKHTAKEMNEAQLVKRAKPEFYL